MKRYILATLAAVALLLGVATTPVFADSVMNSACNNDNTKDSVICAQQDGAEAGFGTLVTNITNTLLYIVGALSVIMIIVGAVKYTISDGDSGKIASAKNTIMYAVVGLVVAMMAYAIVNFVLVNLG